MKVKDLIKHLKKMNLDAEVGYSHHDNDSDEVAGWIYSIDVLQGDDAQKEGYEEIVVLRG